MEKISKKIKAHKNFLMFVVGIFILLAGIIIIWVSSLKIPDFHSFNDRKIARTIEVILIPL